MKGNQLQSHPLVLVPSVKSSVIAKREYSLDRIHPLHHVGNNPNLVWAQEQWLYRLWQKASPQQHLHDYQRTLNQSPWLRLQRLLLHCQV